MEELIQNIVQNIYIDVLDYFGLVKYRNDKSNELVANYSSPFIFLSILYEVYGSPNKIKETLITIDEAQGLAPAEIELIRAVNDYSVILNLFGDEKQHIEGTKGIDSWTEITDKIEFKTFSMMDNYRNARQITEFCNKKFNMKMRSINLDGNGVHEITGDINDLLASVTDLLMNVTNNGLKAIIVKNRREAKYLLHKFQNMSTKFNDMTTATYEINMIKWNVLTIEDAKGLEFGSVIALSGEMTENEKYIAYTRALDELWVYDNAFVLPSKETTMDTMESNAGKTSRKARDKKAGEHNRFYNVVSSGAVKKYFKDAGFKVVDLRNKKTGDLWVVGAKEELKPFVQDAIKKFHITGMYGKDENAGIPYGWQTKTRK